MSLCKNCGKEARVHLTDLDGKTNLYCMDCHNDLLADTIGISHFKDYTRTYTVKRHTFEIQLVMNPLGLLWEASETNGGYYFSLYAKLDSDPFVCLQELYTRINRGVSNKYLKKGERQYKYFLKSSKGIGRIEGGPDNYNNVPSIIIDGKKLTWEEFGRTISVYEGHNLKFNLVDPGDDDGIV